MLFNLPSLGPVWLLYSEEAVKSESGMDLSSAPRGELHCPKHRRKTAHWEDLRWSQTTDLHIVVFTTNGVCSDRALLAEQVSLCQNTVDRSNSFKKKLLELWKIYICYWPAGRSVEEKTVTEVLKMLPEAAGRGQHFQARGHSFSLYGPTLNRTITCLSFFLAVGWLCLVFN